MLSSVAMEMCFKHFIETILICMSVLDEFVLKMDQFYTAISLFRRKKFEECVNVCNELLQKNPQLKGPWELKMRAMIQRVYVDDIEADDGVPGERLSNFDFEFSCISLFDLFLSKQKVMI